MALKHDVKYWKVPRFIKDPEEVENLQLVVEKYYDLLKAEHIWLASSSNFPCVTLNAFTSYSKRAKFQDKNVNQGMLDTLFIAVNVDLEGPDEGGADNREMIRYEFIELLIRVAKAKYFKPMICPNMAESLEMLIQRNIMPINVMDQWQGFRNDLMYKIECNDVLEANIEQLKLIFNIYTRGYLKFITFDNVRDLFMK